MLSMHNVRDLDRDEGAALHAHLFEEQIEWTEPSRKQILSIKPCSVIHEFFCSD